MATQAANKPPGIHGSSAACDYDRHAAPGITSLTASRARPNCRQTKARQSENVGTSSWYQAIIRPETCPLWGNGKAGTVTSENNIQSTGVGWAMAWSDEGHEVSNPRWARASSSVTSLDHRMTTSAGITPGRTSRSGQSRLLCAAAPQGRRRCPREPPPAAP